MDVPAYNRFRNRRSKKSWRRLLGLTTKEEIENLFGKEHTTEKFSWSYNLSDTTVGVSQSSRMGWSAVFPLSVATDKNTRALITVGFNEHQTVSALEVQRFFNTPFTNDYFYLSKHDKDELDSATRAGELSNFRVAEVDKTAGQFLLLADGASDARIIVRLEEQILHITSINPYDRVSNEYRVFRRREAQFIERISASTGADTNTHPRP